MTGDAALAGHVAAISGGLGDIGQAIALELAGRGADVAVGDLRPPEQAGALVGRVEMHGQRARYDRIDVRDAAAVRVWVEAVEADLGVVDLVVCNAATVALADIRSVTADGWADAISTNLNGAFHLAQAGALRLLAHGRPGRIVIVGSWAAHAPHLHVPAYSVAKAGLRMLGRCLALDLAQDGILVNEVAPGYVDAGLSGRAFDATPGLRERSCRQVPTGQLIQPADVARQVANLCDQGGDHMTGSVLLMDGGLSLLNGARAIPD